MMSSSTHYAILPRAGVFICSMRELPALFRIPGKMTVMKKIIHTFSYCLTVR